jgi:dTDP-4-dehydrorhamnose reductase
VLTDRARLAIDDPDHVARALDAIAPWAVVNTAGWVRVDDAEGDPDGCYAANTTGAARMAEACAARNLPFATFSSDLVFGGDKGAPYVEDDPVAPANVYGASKAAAEREVLGAGGRSLVIRTSAFFSPHDPYNFAAWIRRELAAGREAEAAEDLIISPTYVPDLVHATLDLLIDGETGLRHLANAGACSWAEFGRRIAETLGLDIRLVKARPAASFGWPAPRPAMCVLGSRYGALLPSLEDAIGRYAEAVGRTASAQRALEA